MKGFLIAVLLIVLVLGGGWALGWFSFSNSPSDSSIHINKPKVQRDTQKAGEAAQETAKDAVDATKRAVGHAKHDAENARRHTEDSPPKNTDEEKTQAEKSSTEPKPEPATSPTSP